jgi:O-antigen/teichoic acid export membrane protein
MSESGRAFQSRVAQAPIRTFAKAFIAKPAVFGSLIPTVTLMNAVVGMLLPQMMDPKGFGEYALVVTFFNYGLIFDLGMSQVIDRLIPAYLGSGRPDLAQKMSDKLLWMRLNIGAATLIVVAITLTVLSSHSDLPFGLVGGLLATLAGLADMVALGPACIYRARSDRADYALRIAILLSGLIVARLGGLMLGGLIGCFAAMAVWYLGCVFIFNVSMPLQWHARPTRGEMLSLLKQGLPFFLTSFIWAFYVTGNRWIASFLINGDGFGQFAFGANVFSLLVGAIGGFSAFYYPRIAERIASTGHFAQSRLLARDLSLLIVGIALVSAVGIALSGILIGFIYPKYVDGIEVARIMLVAVPPMVLASWLMPVSLSGGNRPWIDGVLVYPLATALLIVFMVLLAHRFGEAGAAWASTVAALPLIAMQLLVLNHAKIVSARDGLVLFVVTTVFSGLLGLLAYWLSL